ncbi:hypothetical protein Cgig2_002223 [Carnegiea gigantea]|uniref:Uncharacterized protein n=1 Tax=Carnegiea gigantea TaxID=171969 RepID=A0A9Q1KRB7_9CARY|nr:hypothetical protein Cgig2_002223 [Carnegiea gigantea]
MEDDEEEGMDADENVNMFLNLENIEDVEIFLYFMLYCLDMEWFLSFVMLLLPVNSEESMLDVVVLVVIFSSKWHPMVIMYYDVVLKNRCLLDFAYVHLTSCCSEQLKFCLLWFSLTPIKKSMMQIIMPKTSRLKLPIVSNPFVPCHAIPQYWTNSISFSYETIILYLVNALPNSCLGLYKGYEWKNAWASTGTWISTKGLMSIYASEGLHLSEAIELTAIGPRKILQIYYIMSSLDKYTQLIVCELLFILLTASVSRQTPNYYQRSSPITRNILTQTSNGLLKFRPYDSITFIVDSNDRHYYTISMYCHPSKGIYFVLWHNCNLPQPHRSNPVLDPRIYITLLLNIIGML